MLLNYISIPVFLISLAIGLFFIYVLGPEEKKVFLYPNPQNVMETIYKDKADQCFKFVSNEVTCPTDASQIQDVPMQD